MKTNKLEIMNKPRMKLGFVVLTFCGCMAALGQGPTFVATPGAIPWNQIGAKAGADCKGGGVAVTPTDFGARLHCVFQRLDGEATPEGLWLTSTVTNTVSDRFRVTAMAVGRKAPNATFNFECPETSIPLADAGEVSVCGQTVRFRRPGLTEEYSVSMDGVRQDFIVEDCPGRARLPPSLPSSQPAGELVVKLAVTGAQVEPAADGARLVLANSGRKIAYSRLSVTDVTGKELPARIEVSSAEDEATSFNSWIVSGKDIDEQNFLSPAANDVKLAVVVNDAEAVYPVRIDPTFSDANWSALGSGMNNGGDVHALAVSGSTLYAGGGFTTAGGSAANLIAQWNGSSWSALGSGMSGAVNANYYPLVDALAVSGSTLYAGGYFTTAGGSAANAIAQWNGSSWSAMGSGMSGAGSDGYGPSVYALVASGSTLYAGGDFTTAGTNLSAYAAMANLAGTPVSIAIITTNAAFGFTHGVFGFDVSGPSGSNVVIQASTDLQTWIPLQTNLLGSGLLYFSDAQSPANVHRFYRAQLLP
jgi:hypothetical protein